MSEYITYKASTVETPTYQLRISSKTPTPSTARQATPTTVLLDTGASISLLPLWKAKELGVEIKEKHNVRVRGADGKLLQIVGVGYIYARDNDATFWKRITVVVTREGNHILISLKDQKRLMLLEQQYPKFLERGKFSRSDRQKQRQN